METTTPQPGQLISPAPPTQNAAPSLPPKAAKKLVAVATPAAPKKPAQPVKPVTPPENPPAEDSDAEDSNEADSGSISWTASEFVTHEKSAGWYFALGIGALLVAALVFLITRDFVSVGVVIVSALILGIYGAHQPRQLDYRLNESGLTIGQKHYDYDEFRSFMIMPEGAFSSVVFMPHKRFAIPLTIYYPPDEEDDIVGLLTNQLPYEEARRDMVDHLLHRIRF